MKKKEKLDILQDWFKEIRVAPDYNLDDELAEVTTYAILKVMQDGTDKKGISFSSLGDTDWDEQNFNPEDANPIYRKIIPKLLTLFGHESVDLITTRDLNQQRISYYLLRKLPERGLVDCYTAENRRRYFVLK